METDKDWSVPYSDENVTFYCYAGGQLSGLRFTVLKAGDNRVAYQAIAPCTGQFVIVATVPRDQLLAEETRAIKPGDAAVIGILLAALMIALAFMVRRVAKR